jgi:lipopolysaccharide/colanic/teichoic acid biosynthesis glycosyltransferase
MKTFSIIKAMAAMLKTKKINLEQYAGIMKKLCVILLFLGLFSAFEPVVTTKFIYAVTYFDNAGVSSDERIMDEAVVVENIPSAPVQEKSHAPEPSTLVLVMSGMGSLIVRFARKSFDKFKRYTDIFLAILGLTILSPIIGFAAFLIKVNSRGPIVYKQNRVGRNGRIFQIYKLRTMVVDAEKNTGAVWAKKNDPRITCVGKVLRKTHIDEIPQLFNVLKGEMSIVGPRPERPEIVRDLKTLILDYEKRLQVKPGITGLAQVFHKYDETIEDVKKKIKYDLLYIHKMCLWVDVRIIGRTFVSVVTGRGAN